MKLWGICSIFRTSFIYNSVPWKDKYLTKQGVTLFSKYFQCGRVTLQWKKTCCCLEHREVSKDSRLPFLLVWSPEWRTAAQLCSVTKEHLACSLFASQDAISFYKYLVVLLCHWTCRWAGSIHLSADHLQPGWLIAPAASNILWWRTGRQVKPLGCNNPP